MKRSRAIFVFSLMLLASTVCVCQTSEKTAGATPRNAFLSPTRYTNAFFGFTLPLPKDSALQGIEMTRKSGYFLFGLKAVTFSFNYKPRLTAFIIMADKATDEDAGRKAASGNQKGDANPVQIGGRPFWESQWEQQTDSGKNYNARWATVANGYVVTFYITSFDKKMAAKLTHSVEHIAFFDPEKAREMAGAGSEPYIPH